MKTTRKIPIMQTFTALANTTPANTAQADSKLREDRDLVIMPLVNSQTASSRKNSPTLRQTAQINRVVSHDQNENLNRSTKASKSIMFNSVNKTATVKREKTPRKYALPKAVCAALSFVPSLSAGLLVAALASSAFLSTITETSAKSVADTALISPMIEEAIKLNKEIARTENEAASEGTVMVADGGFFDPYGTAIKTRRKTKSYYQAKKYKKKKAPKPQYNLGSAKAYFQSFDNEQKLNKYKARNYESYGHSYSGSTYRTMCVRLKDGYYWPINFAQKKYRLKEDRLKCQNSCEGKVRLFYYPSNGQLEKMRDLKGRRYTDLKTAFLYRTEYVKEAQCKPRPWSKEAKAKHEKYAVKDLKKKRKMHKRMMQRAEKKRLRALKKLAKQMARKRGKRVAANKARSRKTKLHVNRRIKKYKNQYSANY